MKKTVILLMGLFLTGCFQDSELDDELIVSEVVYVVYDSQDNLLKVNDSEWLESMDWNTYVNRYDWSPANEQLGVLYDWDTKALIVKSDNYKIIGAVIDSIYTDWDIIDGILHIQVPTMQEYMYNTDLFYFKIKTQLLKQ